MQRGCPRKREDIFVLEWKDNEDLQESLQKRQLRWNLEKEASKCNVNGDSYYIIQVKKRGTASEVKQSLLI